MATGVVSDLDVTDARHVVSQRSAKFTLHALRVIHVVLDKQIVGTHSVKNRQRLAGSIDKVSGNVKRVDRLGHQHDALAFKFCCSVFQVADHSCFCRFARNNERQLAGEAVDSFAVKRVSVSDGLRHANLELRFATRNAGHAALTVVRIACGQIKQGLHQAIGFERGFHAGRRIRVRSHIFHGFKTRLGCGCKAFHKWQLVKQKGEIGGKLWHVKCSI